MSQWISAIFHAWNLEPHRNQEEKHSLVSWKLLCLELCPISSIHAPCFPNSAQNTKDVPWISWGYKLMFQILIPLRYFDFTGGYGWPWGALVCFQKHPDRIVQRKNGGFVKMSRCEDEQMWRWADVKMSRCEDEKMWRCEDKKMWRWADVKMSRCEDEQMWRWADVKMRRCEDGKVW